MCKTYHGHTKRLEIIAPWMMEMQEALKSKDIWAEEILSPTHLLVLTIQQLQGVKGYKQMIG
eukprot:2880284-Karenia_brevis.AAC.1